MALPRVPWWRPVALAAIAVPAIFMLTKERSSDATPLDEKFSNEAADSNGSAAVAQEISRDLMAPGLENTQVGDVRCRATLCRIEASHGSLEAERKFIARLGELEAFRDAEGFVERIPRSDGSIATIVFVSRSGHRLPNSPDAATFPLM